MTETTGKNRKLRPLIITMGGPRQEQMKELFATMSDSFEPPSFSPGIPSRSLNSRKGFLYQAHAVGLLPEAEWDALKVALDDPTCPHDKLFDCLEHVPIEPGRRGNASVDQIHYSVELWQKAKTLNRGRAVLACAFAHLVALKRLCTEDFDMILEDNVRAPTADCGLSINETLDSLRQWEECDESNRCHFRYVGWLGSIPNLQWTYESHVPRTRYPANAEAAVFPFPTTQDIEKDLEEREHTANIEEGADLGNGQSVDKSPGGTAVWGCYAYWASKDAYDQVMKVLRKDVGALMWKSKRMRYYQVKPIDKILPRQIMEAFGKQSVQLPTRPAFFRAPMLTSKIHTQWDPEFCKSTEFQLQRVGLSWSHLWLTDDEKAIVAHHEDTGEWLTLQELKSNQ